MNGTVIRVLLNKGFGFIRGDDKVSRFFHYVDVTPSEDFDTMREGQAVEFTPTDTEKGARALKVKLT